MLYEYLAKGAKFVTNPFRYDNEIHSVIMYKSGDEKKYYDVCGETCSLLFVVRDDDIELMSDVSVVYYDYLSSRTISAF